VSDPDIGPVAGPVAGPVVIEAAINGANPDAPRTPVEISASARACFDAGAAVVHNHIDLFGTAAEAATRYREGWDPVLAVRPDALLYPTINGVGPVAERYSHIAPLAEAGYLRIGVIDPGSVTRSLTGAGRAAPPVRRCRRRWTRRRRGSACRSPRRAACRPAHRR
jgi:hypothetical protein